jgi:hypothetical protein
LTEHDDTHGVIARDHLCKKVFELTRPGVVLDQQDIGVSLYEIPGTGLNRRDATYLEQLGSGLKNLFYAVNVTTRLPNNEHTGSHAFSIPALFILLSQHGIPPDRHIY